MHLVAANVNLGLLDPPWLLPDLALDVLAGSVFVVVGSVESGLVHFQNLFISKSQNLFSISISWQLTPK